MILQKALQEDMSSEHTKRVEYEAIASEKEKQLQYVSQDLHQCKNLLAREKTCSEKLRGDINMLQVYLSVFFRTSKLPSVIIITGYQDKNCNN